MKMAVEEEWQGRKFEGVGWIIYDGGFVSAVNWEGRSEPVKTLLVFAIHGI